MRLRSALIISLLALLASPLHVLASTTPVTQSATTSATVPQAISSDTDTLSPSSPILISPPDGTYTGDNRPEFIWRDSLDSNSNVVTYTLYLNNIATYLGISNFGNSASSTYTSRVDSGLIILRPLSALQDGSYNWKVVASDISGNEASSTTWSFTIDSTPPDILVTAIDHYTELGLSSAHPELFTTLPYAIDGPKDIYFTILSESWSTLTVKIFDPANTLIYQGSWPLNQSGIAYPYTHLVPGRYTVSISSFDRGGNTQALPDIFLDIRQAALVIPLPNIPGIPPELSMTYKPYNIPSLPATISNIQSSFNLSAITYTLLTVSLLLLLVIIWKRKYNLVLLDNKGNPLTNTKVYHSIPTRRSPVSSLLITSHDPMLYQLAYSDHGRLYIKHLSRYSTLTINTNDRTYVMSLSVTSKTYTIIVG